MRFFGWICEKAVFKVRLKISLIEDLDPESMEAEISKEWTALRLIKLTVENDCSHLYVQPKWQT